jgi:hypothetical protein
MGAASPDVPGSSLWLAAERPCCLGARESTPETGVETLAWEGNSINGERK